MPNDRAVGIVIGYRRAGYGWLDWNGVRVWIHVQDVRDQRGNLLPALKTGWHIQFDVSEAPKGPRARNAVVIDATANTEGIQCQHPITA